MAKHSPDFIGELDEQTYQQNVSREQSQAIHPFAALKGFEEAIAAKEKNVVPKIELSEEMLQELDKKCTFYKRVTSLLSPP